MLIQYSLSNYFNTDFTYYANIKLNFIIIFSLSYMILINK